MNEKTINKDRTALITGGSGGIGYAIARKFSFNNIRTSVADIAGGVEASAGIQHFHCDISSGRDIDRLYGQLHEQQALPDILVCNAGRGIHERLTEGDPEKWQRAFEINVMGALRCIRAFVPYMLEKGFGDVVIISSVSANQPYEYGAIYAASKTSLEVIAETLRRETLGVIRVAVIAPGVTDTGFFDHLIAGYQNPEDFDYPPMPPEEVAESVWYAVSKPKEININKIILRPSSQFF